MTTEERLAAIERKLDLLLNTVGIRETMTRESQHKVDTLLAMPLDDMVAHMKAKRKAALSKRR